MSPTEQRLRAALFWALSTESGHDLIKHEGPFDFCATGKVKIGDRTTERPLLWWEDRGRVVTVSTSPAGRILHYVDAYADHSFRLEMNLPREFWAQAAVKESLTARPIAERRGYLDLGDTSSADEESGW